MPIEIPIFVVCTNEGSFLREWLDCVDSLASPAVTPVPCIADNGSSDTTVGVIWDAIRTRRLKAINVLWLHNNLGFAAAQNQLIRHLGSRRQHKWFATLNIDARADAKWLRLLVTTARKKTDDPVGMWGGPILEPGGHRISSAGHALREDGAFLDVDWKCDLAGNRFSMKSDFEPFSPCFAAALWSFSMVKEVGLPDGGQFLYYDDVELAFKARLLGWRAVFVPKAVAYHPLPNSKKTVDCQRRLQLRGRLLMVLRYLPDVKAQSILQGLSDDEKTLVAAIDARDKRSFLDDARRTAVYNAWAGRCIRVKSNG